MTELLEGVSSIETELDELVAVARQAAREGADVALSWQERRLELCVEEKAASDDLVSQADREAEQAIRAVLSRLRPGDAVLGEELGQKPGVSGVLWHVDPIDGTTNYLYGRSDWAVSVAAVRAGDGAILAGVVHEPALGCVTEARLGGGTFLNAAPARCRPTSLSRALVETNIGRPRQRGAVGRVSDALLRHVRDVRRGGSAAAALAQVATGRADAYWGPGLQPWDAAAGLLLVAEAGGRIGDLDGPSAGVWPSSGNVLASSKEIWEDLRVLLEEAFGADGE